MALVILLSAFNGIEQMVVSLYSDFDSEITVRSKYSKSFFESEINLKDVKKTAGVDLVSRAVEETVVLKHEEKKVVASLSGVDPTFLTIADMKNHMVEGYPTLNENNKNVGIIGASLLMKLEGYIPENMGTETILIYGPKRNMKVSLGKNPFTMELLPLSGSMHYNREVNDENIIVPLETAQFVLGYSSNEINALYISVKPTANKDLVKKLLQTKLGERFEVKTNYEKNELIFQTSRTERLFVLFILVFIFILASFNLVASITMLFVEKKNDIETLRSMGANRSDLFKIFFFEGLLISFKGIIIGLILGYAICAVQLQFSLLQMPNSNGQAFPIVLTFKDGVLIVFLVSLLSTLASYFPVRMLINRNVKRD